MIITQPISQNEPDFENEAYIIPTGFREYDARWLYPDQINLLGIQRIGQGLGTQMAEKGVPLKIVVGHDSRSYSQAIKQAFIVGLMNAGIEVFDIGLCLSPIAYFAQFHLDIPSVAMITASHNGNGWTGIKMGCYRPFTHDVEDMFRLKQIVLEEKYLQQGGGKLHDVKGVQLAYLDDLTKRFKFSRKIKAVVATGNGTAGVFAPDVLECLGIEVVRVHTELDNTFPHYNPNPEDMTMLHHMAEMVKLHNADIALGFDGDGDRCGVVDNEGNEIFADKMGVLLARHLVKLHPNASFVADVKSTGLFLTDEVLQAAGAKTDYWKTGHSYMKRRVGELNALAGFEKSGHYFLNAPIGLGYDDGILSALWILDMLDKNPKQSVSEMVNSLQKTWLSPTMSPYCSDNEKSQVIEKVTADILSMFEGKIAFKGLNITNVVTTNGVRFTCEDGAWGLVRASSNKPNLVVVVESPVSELRMKEMFLGIDAILKHYPQVGEYDQVV